MKAHAHRRLELLRVHHEPAVATKRHNLAAGLDDLGSDRCGQPGAHRGERIVEQNGVGLERLVAAGDVDLVHAVVEAQDGRWLERLAQVRDDALDVHWEIGSRGVHAAEDHLLLALAAPLIKRVVPVRLRLELFFDLPERIPDVAHHLGVREVHGVGLCRAEAEVDHHGLLVGVHEERRLFDDVVADVEDDCGVQRSVKRQMRVEGGWWRGGGGARSACSTATCTMSFADSAVHAM